MAYNESTEELQRETYIQALQTTIPLEELQKKTTVELERLYYIFIIQGGGSGGMSTPTTWKQVTSKYTVSNPYEWLDVFPNADNIEIILPNPSQITASSRIDIYNQTDKDWSVVVKDYLGAIVKTIEPVNSYSFYFTSPFIEWIAVHTSGKAYPILNVDVYGDFNSIAWANVPSGTYNMEGLGNQFSNYCSDFSLLTTSTYFAEVRVINTGKEFGIETIFGSSSDFSNPFIGRESRRVGVDFGSSVSVDWKCESLLHDKAYFFVSNKLPSGSGGDIKVNSDADNPTFLSGMTVDKAKGMTLVSQAEGSIRNDTGRTIELMTGTINLNPIISAGTASLIIISERSLDGVTWTGNLNSKRQVEISNNTETFATKLSVVTDWLPNELIRFRVYLLSGNLTLEPNSSTALGGQTFYSPSVAWSLHEA